MISKSFKIGQLIEVTSGKNHAWYRTNRGFLVRKPIGNIRLASAGWENVALFGVVAVAFSASAIALIKIAELYH